MDFILLIAALICFILAAIKTGGPIDLTAAGLALWIASIVF